MALTPLQIVALASSNISSVDAAAFRGLPYLQALDLYTCRLQEAPNLFYIRSTLKWLTLRRNYIQSLPHDYFQGCTHLVKVDIGENELARKNSETN